MAEAIDTHLRAAQQPRRQSTVDMLAASNQEIGERAIGLVEQAASAARERPYTTLAVAAGLAFAMGALWKSGRRPQSRWDVLKAQIRDHEDWVPRRWR